MALLVFLKREGFGAYQAVDEFVGELARRSTSALGGFAAVLASKSPDDVKEAAQGDGQNVCTDLVRDLRAPKGARIAALRALMLAGGGANLPKVFAGAADLFGDARVPEADRTYLGKTGLGRFLESLEPQKVSLEVARGAATAAEVARVLGQETVKEVVASYPPNHAGALTVLHAALGEPLSDELRQRWLDLLAKQFKAAKNAPAAAKRLGRAPEWPPVVPEVFRPLLLEAEQFVPAPQAPEATAVVGTGPDTPARTTREGPALERASTRTAAAPSTREFRGSDQRVDPAQLRSRTPPTPHVLKSLRLAPHVELLTTRGVRALERTMAAFDARVAIIGLDKALSELRAAAEARGSQDVNQPMMDELLASALDAKTASSWRRAARILLESLSPDRAATLSPLAEPVRRSTSL